MIKPAWIDETAIDVLAAKHWGAWRKTWRRLPFCVESTEDGARVLDRDFRPIGEITTGVFERIRDAEFLDPVGERLFCYTDATAPWVSRRAYEHYAFDTVALLLAFASGTNVRTFKIP